MLNAILLSEIDRYERLVFEHLDTALELEQNAKMTGKLRGRDARSIENSYATAATYRAIICQLKLMLS